MLHSKPKSAASITFRPTDEIQAWLERKATEGYRTVSAQVRMIIEAAMKLESEQSEVRQ